MNRRNFYWELYQKSAESDNEQNAKKKTKIIIIIVFKTALISENSRSTKIYDQNKAILIIYFMNTEHAYQEVAIKKMSE